MTLIANYVPFEEPGGGPNFFPFDDSALYEIHISNNGSAQADITYQFRFTTMVGNPNTFLYNAGPITSLTDPNWNIRQMYTLTRIANGQSTVLGTNLPCPPDRIGPRYRSPFDAELRESGGRGCRDFYTDPELCWQVIEIIPTDTPTTRTHTEVTQQLLAGNIIYTGVFPPLPLGEYRVSRPEMRRNERFSIAAGHVTQIDWRSQS